MVTIKKAILPVAGLGTRFLPATKAQPKEMLPIVDKPVVQYLVEEAIASGIEEIIFVTGRGKRAIEDHFDYSPELEFILRKKNKENELKEVKSISEMAKFAFVRQKEPKGDGDAVLQAFHLIQNEPVAVLFGDDIVDSKIPCLKQLIDVFNKYREPVIALERIPKKDTKKFGIVSGIKIEKNIIQINDIIEKPSKEKAPSNLAIVGKYIITPQVFEELKAIKQPESGELRLAEALKNTCKKQKVYGVLFDGIRYDCGSKLGFLKATIDFALKHKEVKKDFRQYIKKVSKTFE